MVKPTAELAALFDPVLAWLDKGGDDQLAFNMSDMYAIDFASTWDGRDCGTSACIAGALGVFNPDLNYGGILFDGEQEEDYSRAHYADDALVRHYGMTPDDRQGLFYTYMDLSPADAAAMIRYWITTGDVIRP